MSTEDPAKPEAIAEGYQGIGLTADDLVERAVRNAGHNREPQRVRWAYVRSTFGLGSTSSAGLCRRFGLDPDELVGTDPEEDGEWL